MRTLVLVSLVFAVCYLLARPVFSNRWQLLGFRQLFLSGGEFLLVGYLVGPRGLDLISPPVAAALDPVLHLGVGWAGLIFGLQFNRRFLAVYPLPRYLLAFVQALVAGVVTGAAALFVVPVLFPEADRVSVLRIALLVGLTAAPTSPASLHYFSDLFGIRGRVNRLLRFVAGVDGIPPVLVLGLVAGFFHVWAIESRAAASRFDLAGWQWMAVEVLLGVVLGVLLIGLVELQIGREERLLFVLGMVVLAGGLAHYLQLSALFVAFVMGLCVANGAWHREEVHKVAAYAEKPIYLTLLVLAGANLALDWRVAALAVVIVAIRLLGKVAGNVGWPLLTSEPAAQTPWLGLALLPQGALTILLAVDVLFFFREDAARYPTLVMAVSAVLVGALLNEVLSPILLRLASPAPMRRLGGSGP